jgi:hypothetical protein
MTTFAGRWATPLLWLLTLIVAAHFVWQTAEVRTRHSDGFAAYYTSARLVRDGRAGSRLYDDAWFGEQIDRFVPGVRDIYNANPPTTAIMLLPLSWASYGTARSIWMLLTLALLVATFFLIIRETRLSVLPVLIFVCASLASEPLHANMRQGQVYVLMLALATLVWIGYRRNDDRLAGVPLGVMLALKTAGLFLPLLFLLGRRWRALVWTLSTAAVLSAASFAWFGPGAWRAYLHYLTGLRTSPDLSVTAYQTVTSLVRHLMIFDATWNPAPLVDAPMAGAVVTLVVALALVGATLAVVARSGDADLSFAALLTLTILLSPVSLDYHYTALLLPFAILLSRVHALDDRWAWIILALSAVLVLADLQYGSARLSRGAWALFAYPKLAGGLLLWGDSVWLMFRSSRATEKAPASARVVTA